MSALGGGFKDKLKRNSPERLLCAIKRLSLIVVRDAILTMRFNIIHRMTSLPEHEGWRPPKHARLYTLQPPVANL